MTVKVTERLKKLELVTEYHTSKGTCRLEHPSMNPSRSWIIYVFTPENKLVRVENAGQLRASAMQYIREQLK